MNDISFYIVTKTKVDNTFVIYKTSAPDTGGIDALLNMQEDLNETTIISLEAKVDGKIVYFSQNNSLTTIGDAYTEAELKVEEVIQ